MRVVVVGGGYSGVSFAVQAARRAPSALDISVVEPAAALGRGLAYGTRDPDHRINGPMSGHSVDLNDLEHPHAWVRRVRLHEEDPHLEAPEGFFPRRADFARYLADSFADHAAANPSASTLRQVRARARDLVAPTDAKPGHVALDDGRQLQADLVVLATGNPPPRVPPALAALAAHPAIITDCWQSGRLARLPPDHGIVVMGGGLTAADMLATLVRQRHRGPITVFSRHGLRPREQRPVEPPAEPLPPTWLIDRIHGEVPGFACAIHGQPLTVRGLTRALRRRIGQVQREGRAWQAGFDELRDVVWQVWPGLSLMQQQRFLARLRPWYDVHRFRIAPQTLALIEPAVASGQVRFRAARLESVREARSGGAPALRVELRARHGERIIETCQALINCTGLDSGGQPAAGSMLARMLGRGELLGHPTGLGFVVDAGNRVVTAQGVAQPRLRMIGPPTAGQFGDPLGVLFIAAQIDRVLTDVFR